MSDGRVALMSLERLVKFVVSDTEDPQSRLGRAQRSSKHHELGSERNVEQTAEQLVSNEAWINGRLTVQQPVSTYDNHQQSLSAQRLDLFAWCVRLSRL